MDLAKENMTQSDIHNNISKSKLINQPQTAHGANLQSTKHLKNKKTFIKALNRIHTEDHQAKNNHINIIDYSNTNEYETRSISNESSLSSFTDSNEPNEEYNIPQSELNYFQFLTSGLESANKAYSVYNRASRMFSSKFSDTHREIINSIIKERSSPINQNVVKENLNNIVAKEESDDSNDDIESVTNVKTTKANPKRSVVILQKKNTPEVMKSNLKSSLSFSNSVNISKSLKNLLKVSKESVSRVNSGSITKETEAEVHFEPKTFNISKSTVSIEKLKTNSASSKKSESNLFSRSPTINSYKSISNNQTNKLKGSNSFNISTKKILKPRDLRPTSKTDSHSSFRLTDFIFSGYHKNNDNSSANTNEMKIKIDNKKDSLIDLGDEPNFISPFFNIKRYNVDNKREFELAKEDLYKRYSFINDPAIRSKSAKPFNFVVTCKAISPNLNYIKAF